MGGAETIVLDEHLMRGGEIFQHGHAGAHHHGDAAEYLFAGGDQVAQHRAAGDRMGRLRQRRFHTGA